jgi:polyhydroxyalkanoate synthesis regulator phasin
MQAERNGTANKKQRNFSSLQGVKDINQLRMRISDMTNLVEKGFLLSLGLLALTRDRAEKVVEDLIEKGKLTREDAPKVLKDLLAKAEEEKKALEARIDAGLERALQRFNLPTRKELEEVNKKLDQVLKELKKKS